MHIDRASGARLPKTEHPQESPALSLPPEILSDVLSLSGHSLSGANGIRLTHVCRQWRQVLFGVSEYWEGVVASSKFNKENDVSFLSFILDRSSPRPIKLHDARLLPSIAIILAPNWHRIVYFDVLILAMDHLRELHDILHDAVSSSLQHLSIRFRIYTWDFNVSSLRLRPLPSGVLPSLYRLRTHALYLPFVVVPSLRQLHVSSSTGYPGSWSRTSEAPEALFDALAICTRLEKLEIGELFADNYDLRVVYMHHLKKLSIQAWGVTQIVSILRTLRFPATTVIKLDFGKFNITDRLRDILKLVHPTADSVRVNERDGYVVALDLIESDIVGATMRFKADSRLCLAGIADFFLGRPTMTKFERIFLADFLSRPPHVDVAGFRWRGVFPSFPNITRLSVRRCQPVDLVIGLASRSFPIVVGPPCLRLEELVISWHAADLDRYLSHLKNPTVRQRARAVADSFVSSLINRHQRGATPLKLLELHEYDPDISLFAEVVLDPGDTQAIEDALAAVRAHVNGPVVFNVVAGPITSP